ncbi:Putative uncharacterized protein [Bifidobacterium animalis subsp. animalis IM386]|uniref:Uncharacterized protein n=2 Tax=Bifidobacterium animalis TaxID=28025 RepID=A0AAV2W1L2_9BIFI|nr:Putative uncharacterized protein [Bifidobacterium animalis subsp. animalis IM386]
MSTMRKPDSREALRMALGTVVFAVIMVVLTGFQNGWHSLTTVRGVLDVLVPTLLWFVGMLIFHLIRHPRM